MTVLFSCCWTHLGPQFANKLDELLERVELTGAQVCATEHIHITEDISIPRRDSNLTAWVNVIYGCNEKCTYCVVPYTRGAEQSRRPEDIRREMMALGEAGTGEESIVLTFQYNIIIHTEYIQHIYIQQDNNMLPTFLLLFCLGWACRGRHWHCCWLPFIEKAIWKSVAINQEQFLIGFNASSHSNKWSINNQANSSIFH